MKNTLILGFGSDLLSDEGIVHRIIYRLQREKFDADYKVFPILTLELIEEITGYQKIIIIDTLKTKDGIPGFVKVCPIQEYEPTLHLENFHDISLPEMINFAATLGFSITKDIIVIAVEICDHSTISTDLSLVIAEKFPLILKEILSFAACELAPQTFEFVKQD